MTNNGGADDMSQRLESSSRNAGTIDDHQEDNNEHVNGLKSNVKPALKVRKSGDEDTAVIEAKRKEIKALEMTLAAKEQDLFRVRRYSNMCCWLHGSVICHNDSILS